MTGSPLYRLQLKRLFRLGDHFTAYSSVMARRAMELGCPREKLTVLTVGIDLDRFKFRERKPSKDINVLFIGRLVEKKGCIFAVRAFAKSYRKHRNIRFTIGGDGPLQGEIETEIRKLGIENVARMIGPVRDTSAELEKADIFISPSVVARNGDAEGGINVAVLEALASGLPCLVTKESQSDAVFDGETGFVAKERDADDLSRKLDTLIENPQLIPKFGIIGRRKVEKLDSRVQVGKLEEIYKDLIRKYER